MTKLNEHYKIICTEWSDVFDHIQTFVDTVCELDAQKVIELGVRYGVSTVAWIWALQHTGGHLWAVDGAPPVEEPTMKVDLLNPLMDLPQWDFVLGWDTQQHVLDVLPTDADIVFIDTNHIYEETLIELETYLPRVRSGGRILLHDTMIEKTGNAVTPQPLYPVLTALREFCSERNLYWTNVDYCMGLGQIHVP